MSSTPTHSSTSFIFREGDKSFTQAPWTYTEQGGLTAEAGNGFLRFSVKDQQDRNRWCVFKQEAPYPVPRDGLVITTRVNLAVATGSESKYNLPGEVILRVTADGRVSKYNYWQSGFFDLATSNISPGSGWHTISIIYQADSTTLFEDGKFMFTWETKNTDGVNFNVSCQLLDSGASADYSLGDLRASPLANVSIPPMAVFEPGTDLSVSPWVMKPNSNGPKVTAHDGFIRYDDENQTDRNQWLYLSLDSNFSMAGAVSQNFRLRMNSTNSSEVKFSLANGVIVRWTDRGTTAQYQYWDQNGFHTLGKCSAVVGGGWAAISVVFLKTRTVVYEDDERVFIWDKDNGDEINMTYHFQVLDAGSGTSVDLSNIGYNTGLYWKQ